MPPSDYRPTLDPDVVESFAGRRILVTGTLGFLGGAAQRALAGHGLDVHPLVADLRDERAMEREVAALAPEIVVHFAAKVDASRDPSLDEVMAATNFHGALNLHRACTASRSVSRFVHVGTCEEYGPIDAPFCETDEPSLPASPYGRSKLAATRALLARAGDRPEVVVTRPFLTYGPGQKLRQLLPAAIVAALSGVPFPMTRGEQTREWNHLDDTIRGVLRAAVKPGLDGLILNVACGEERTVASMAALVFSVLGADPGLLRLGEVPERPAEVPRFFADTKRCRSVLGHMPRTSMEAGILSTAGWYASALGLPPRVSR